MNGRYGIMGHGNARGVLLPHFTAHPSDLFEIMFSTNETLVLNKKKQEASNVFDRGKPSQENKPIGCA